MCNKSFIIITKHQNNNPLLASFIHFAPFPFPPQTET